MKHLFQDDEGELVAADTLEQAARYLDCELGGEPEPREGWSQVPDGARVPIRDADDDKPGETVTKTAAEWATECDRVALVSSYYA